MIIVHNYHQSHLGFAENRLVFQEKPSAKPTPEELASKKDYEEGGIAGAGVTQEQYEAGLKEIEAAASSIGQPKEKPQGPVGAANVDHIEVHGIHGKEVHAVPPPKTPAKADERMAANKAAEEAIDQQLAASNKAVSKELAGGPIETGPESEDSDVMQRVEEARQMQEKIKEEKEKKGGILGFLRGRKG
jgi:hypothetical protein